MYPAAYVPDMQRGGKAAIVNRDRTHLDLQACCVGRDLKEEFEALAAELKKR